MCQQYIKNKRHMCSLKFCELYMDDGLVFKIQIYSVTKFTDTESLGQTGSIVLHLMQSYQNNGCHLLTENWYNSVSSTKYMSKIKNCSKTKPITGSWKEGSKG